MKIRFTQDVTTEVYQGFDVLGIPTSAYEGVFKIGDTIMTVISIQGLKVKCDNEDVLFLTPDSYEIETEQ